MRLVLAVGIWIATLGSVYAFMSCRHASHPPRTQQLEQLARPPDTTVGYVLRLTRTFPLEADPFGLDPQDNAPGFEIRLDGTSLDPGTIPIEPDRALEISLPALVRNHTHECLIEAVPPHSEARRPQALRAQLIFQDTPLIDHVFWAEPGMKITGLFTFDIPPSASSKEQTHAH